MDPTRVDSALQEAATKPYLFSILVARHDSLVVEYYKPTLSFHNDYQIRSATKSVISVLIGIALDEGLIPGVDTPFLDIMPEYRREGQDPRKDSINLRHLLSMRAGIDFEDGGRNSDVVAASDDWISTWMGLPFLTFPGDSFAYSSLQSHLLSAVIAKTSGMPTADFARERLFAPLQITARYWDRDPQGLHIGGSGITLTARDMLRFGQMVLRNGTLDGVSVVSGAWVDSSFAPRNSRTGRWSGLTQVNYGYQWWMNTEPDRQIWFAAGYGGQFIIVDRSRDMVVVATAETNVDLNQSSVQMDAILELLVRSILPAAA